MAFNSAVAFRNEVLRARNCGISPRVAWLLARWR